MFLLILLFRSDGLSSKATVKLVFRSDGLLVLHFHCLRYHYQAVVKLVFRSDRLSPKAVIKVLFMWAVSVTVLALQETGKAFL